MWRLMRAIGFVLLTIHEWIRNIAFFCWLLRPLRFLAFAAIGVAVIRFFDVAPKAEDPKIAEDRQRVIAKAWEVESPQKALNTLTEIDLKLDRWVTGEEAKRRARSQLEGLQDYCGNLGGRYPLDWKVEFDRRLGYLQGDLYPPADPRNAEQVTWAFLTILLLIFFFGTSGD